MERQFDLSTVVHFTLVIVTSIEMQTEKRLMWARRYESCWRVELYVGFSKAAHLMFMLVIRLKMLTGKWSKVAHS